ncbi:tetratricopeptide repeat protein [Permianibacter sp. IMCC34836]|uniref:tetratricopeptide repeat protein n=1 Tax=Permianibacter fluminis TaxID=2738515 RepID=UPI001556F119|nr:tetratricopeptide repeat protein [Permianibacter fluminis]NQD38974.1 tetratricopeptide repeat protein [Permianibacter fluminis]
MAKLLISGALFLSLTATAVQAGLETSLTKNCAIPEQTAQAEGRKKDKDAQLEEKTYKIYKKAQEAYQAKDFPTVITLLTPLDEKPPRKDYDKAMVQNLLAYAYSESDDYANAASHIEQALATGALPDEQQLAGWQNLVTFYLQAEQNEAALAAIDRYFTQVKAVKPEMYLVKAQLLSKLERPQDAICPAYVAIKLHPQPKLEWLRMLADLHGEIDRFEDAILVQKEVTAAAPDNSEQLLHLANLYILAQRDSDAFALLADIEQKGLLNKEKDVKNLATMYWNNGQYEKSAGALERGIARGALKANEATWKSIAQAWKQANNGEKVAYAYGEAGKLASTGEAFLFQGEKLSELKQWDKAIVAYQHAIEKGGLAKNEGHTWLVLGYAQFRNSDFKAAMKSLEKAATYPDSKKEANDVMQQVKAQL